MGFYRMYQDVLGQWRWRYVASNGKIIGISSESYVNKSDCRHSIVLMKLSVNAPVHE